MTVSRKLTRWILVRFIIASVGVAALLAGAAAVRAQVAAGAGDQVYRIVILTSPNFQQATKGKELLEGWKYEPVIIEQLGTGTYRVLYGYFPSQEAARQALNKMQAEGISAREIIQTPAAMPTSGSAAATSGSVTYSVLMREFGDEAQAQALKTQLQQAGFSPVMVRSINNFYQVYVGNGSSASIDQTFAKLRQQGYLIENVSKVVVSPADAPTPTPTPRVASRPTEGGEAGQNVISPEITQSAIWKQLSEDQKRQVLNSVLMQKELRSGDAMAQQVIDINKRLENLDERVKAVVKQIDEERNRQAEVMKQITDKTAEAENFIRANDFQKAMLRYREIVDLDKDNHYGQKAFAERRIVFLQSRLKGEAFEGQSEENSKRYEQLKKETEPLARSGNVDDLTQARLIWQQIKNLDPTRWGQEASTQINSLSQQIEALESAAKAEQDKASKQQNYLMFGLAGGFVLLLAVVIVISLRQRKRHRELMKTMHEITAMRPMRELTGGGTAGLLGGPGATGVDTDVFTPRTPGGADMNALDPLGGIEEPEPARKKKGKGAAPAAAPAAASHDAMDDIFGDLGGGNAPAASPATASGEGDAFGFDDIFGAPTGQTDQVAAAPTAASGMGDTAFDNLFESPEAEPIPASHTASKQVQQNVEPTSEIGPISFDDLVAVHNEPAPAAAGTPAAPENDLLSMFGSIGGSAKEGGNGQQPAPAMAESSADDNPFSSFMNDLPQSEHSPARDVPPVEDDTEIPSIRLDMSESSPVGSAQSGINFDFNSPAPESDQTSTSMDLPAFSFDDLTAIESVAKPAASVPVAATQTASFAGVELDFEEDSAGQPPVGWEGEYPFASLLVKGDTPPRNSQQYLAFEKREGAGKALFTYHFPNISGVVGVEFDLRCNDKNKFLLGFYIEKDGDFQQSVHTKILRSEAQTTPTIHMQGESAPYLLGSWAHIKYVVDLNQGKVNGYIDSTHVARDLPLSPNPQMLNTLSIRDNINTTGILLLDNIKVYQIA